MLNNKEIKDILFEIYSAGFESGYSQEKDIKSAFEEYYNFLLSEVKKYEKNTNN